MGEIRGAALATIAYLAEPPLQAVLVCAIGLVLLASSVVDAKTQRLPDRLTVAVAALALGLDAVSSITQLVAGLIAAALVFVAFEAVRRGFLRLRGRPGLGFGDVKLATALALWLGLAIPWAMLLAASLGLVTILMLRPSNGRLAFGPSLAAAGWVVGLMREAHLWPSLI
jgi:leader peptidase (prepilin peptidase)/N-methyltransferase